MKIFTINSGSVSEGAVIEKLLLKGANLEIPAIIVGEEGRGRERGVLPVQLTNLQYPEWKMNCKININSATTSKTKSGKPKLVVSETENVNDNSMIGVFYTEIGFRGGNSHTGDRDSQPLGNGDEIKFLPFPGEIICQGMIAQGDAGRMGSGSQIIAVIPKNSIFRTGYSGRLYGSPRAHYYFWDGEKLTGGITWDDREISDIF
ncbi:MAG TPA: hypothetical protein PK720_01555 [bacterium]|nr:hypothetical protein [bacterium]